MKCDSCQYLDWNYKEGQRKIKRCFINVQCLKGHWLKANGDEFSYSTFDSYQYEGKKAATAAMTCGENN